MDRFIEIQAIELTNLQLKFYNACLNDDYNFVIMSCGRQVGKSICALQVICSWIFNNKDYKVCYYAPTFKQCKEQYRRLEAGLGNNKGMIFNKSELTLKIKNGSFVQFQTAENDNMRGSTYDSIIVDEACFVKNDIFNAGILPTIAISLSLNKGKVVLTSTPKTKNWFYNMVLRGSDKGFCVIKATSEEGGLISKDILEIIKASTPEHLYKNEYMGEFVEEGEGIFSYNNCIASEIESKSFKSEHNVAGLDFGMENDYTVLTIMNYKGELLHIQRWHRIDWMSCLDSVVKSLIKYNAICYAETNGIGNMPFKELKKKYVNTREWITSAKSKVDIINKMSSDFKNELIKIPKIDYLLEELDAYTMEYNPSTGKVSYGGRSDFHDDCVMSLAICNFNRTSGLPTLRHGKKIV